MKLSRCSRWGIRVAAGVLALCLTGRAQADLLNLELLDAPDITSGFITVDFDYNAGTHTGLLSATGWALTFDDDGVGAPFNIDGGSTSLTATLDETGHLAPGGTLTIFGTVSALGFNSGTLLTGVLTAFGFSNDPNTEGDFFEFLIDITGGDAADLYGTGPAGEILSGTGFDGSFGEDFGNTGFAFNDVAPIPSPTSAIMGVLGLAIVGLLKRRSSI